MLKDSSLQKLADVSGMSAVASLMKSILIISESFAHELFVTAVNLSSTKPLAKSLWLGV